MSNAMSLKAKIRNIAKAKNLPAQVILQNYMFERLLVRLAQSEYREKFVLKQFGYAKDISFEMILMVLRDICRVLS